MKSTSQDKSRDFHIVIYIEKRLERIIPSKRFFYYHFSILTMASGRNLGHNTVYIH